MRLLQILLLLILAAPLRAEDRLWSAVVVGSNKGRAAEPPAELKAIMPRLKRLFGYSQFEIIGTDVKPVEDGAEFSLVPSANFWFSLKARESTIKEARGGYLLNVELFHDKRSL